MGTYREEEASIEQDLRDNFAPTLYSLVAWNDADLRQEAAENPANPPKYFGFYGVRYFGVRYNESSGIHEIVDLTDTLAYVQYREVHLPIEGGAAVMLFKYKHGARDQTRFEASLRGLYGFKCTTLPSTIISPVNYIA